MGRGANGIVPPTVDTKRGGGMDERMGNGQTGNSQKATDKGTEQWTTGRGQKAAGKGRRIQDNRQRAKRHRAQTKGNMERVNGKWGKGQMSTGQS